MKASAIKAKLNTDIFSIEEFEELVREGLINDDYGIAQLIIDDELRPDYNIFIGRRLILKSGSIISFWGLLKMYGEENIQIKYSFTV